MVLYTHVRDAPRRCGRASIVEWDSECSGWSTRWVRPLPTTKRTLRTHIFDHLLASHHPAMSATHDTASSSSSWCCLTLWLSAAHCILHGHVCLLSGTHVLPFHHKGLPWPVRNEISLNSPLLQKIYYLRFNSHKTACLRKVKAHVWEMINNPMGVTANRNSAYQFSNFCI